MSRRRRPTPARSTSNTPNWRASISVNWPRKKPRRKQRRPRQRQKPRDPLPHLRRPLLQDQQRPPQHHRMEHLLRPQHRGRQNLLRLQHHKGRRSSRRAQPPLRLRQHLVPVRQGRRPPCRRQVSSIQFVRLNPPHRASPALSRIAQPPLRGRLAPKARRAPVDLPLNSHRGRAARVPGSHSVDQDPAWVADPGPPAGLGQGHP